MIVEDYFLIEPDWQSYISLGRRWRTSLQVTLNKDEKRAKLIDYPFKRLQFVVVPFDPSENNYIRRKLYRARDKIFGVPIWCDRCQTTMDVDSGTGVTFTVNSNSYRQFEVGGLLIFYEDKDNYEVKEISAIGSNQFTVDSSFTGEWASGTHVYPVLQGRLRQQLTLPQVTTYGHGPVSVEIAEEYDEDITRTVYSGSAYSTYLTYKVFNTEPEYSEYPESAFDAYPTVLQFLGKSISYAHTTEGTINVRNNYRFYSREEVYELIKLFDESCGKWGEFWFPSWQDDIIITAPFSSSDTVLEIEDVEWEAYWQHNKTIGRFLYVRLPDGTEILRKIIGAPLSTQIEVDSAMGTTITTTAGLIACFLYMGRFNIDELTVRWMTEEVSTSEVELFTVKNVITVTTTTTT